MKYIISCIASVTIIVANAYAAPEDFIWSFKGTEKSTLTNCGAYDGTTTGSWSVTNSDLKGTSFVGKGSNKDGDFTATGEISGATATGTTKGVNKWGQAWTGEFSAMLDGDKYSSISTGIVPASGCKFLPRRKRHESEPIELTSGSRGTRLITAPLFCIVMFNKNRPCSSDIM
jgi:hypothetical protein